MRDLTKKELKSVAGSGAETAANVLENREKALANSNGHSKSLEGNALEALATIGANPSP